jgi:hypothetical protein
MEDEPQPTLEFIVAQLLRRRAIIESGEPFQLIISRHPNELKITLSQFETIQL